MTNCSSSSDTSQLMREKLQKIAFLSTSQRPMNRFCILLIFELEHIRLTYREREKFMDFSSDFLKLHDHGQTLTFYYLCFHL